jgi:uncharacterized protein (TIGR03000 family)
VVPQGTAPQFVPPNLQGNPSFTQPGQGFPNAAPPTTGGPNPNQQGFPNVFNPAPGTSPTAFPGGIGTFPNFGQSPLTTTLQPFGIPSAGAPFFPGLSSLPTNLTGANLGFPVPVAVTAATAANPSAPNGQTGTVIGLLGANGLVFGLDGVNGQTSLPNIQNGQMGAMGANRLQGTFPFGFTGFQGGVPVGFISTQNGIVPAGYMSNQQTAGTQGLAMTNAMSYAMRNLPPGSFPGPAVIDIRLPSDAEVTINGEQLNQSGGDRRFVSQTLNPNAAHSYEIKAVWTQNGKKVGASQRVIVQAGDYKGVTFIRGTPLEEE